MKLSGSNRHLLYALISFVSPVAAFLIIQAYQSVAHVQEWEAVGPEGGMATGFLALAELVQIAFALLLGTIVGLIFAVLTIRKRRGAGFAALVFNGLPFVLLSFLVIRGMTQGW